MTKITVPFNKSGVDKLPNDKPVTYTIETFGGRDNYTGVAKRGRVHDRLAEHFNGAKDAVPGSKVTIEQHSSLKDALAKEARLITRNKPIYNKKGK
jgi:hypothetical protein